MELARKRKYHPFLALNQNLSDFAVIWTAMNGQKYFSGRGRIHYSLANGPQLIKNSTSYFYYQSHINDTEHYIALRGTK